MKTTYLKAYEEFLTRLKQARKDAGITQEELARRLGRPQSFVSKYENSERRLDLVEFVQISHAIRINTSDFIQALINDLGLRRKAKP